MYHECKKIFSTLFTQAQFGDFDIKKFAIIIYISSLALIKKETGIGQMIT